MITGYKKGADLTLMDATYIKPRKVNDKWESGKMIIVYKDNVTNEKKIECIENPDYEFYKLKENVPVRDYMEIFRDKNDVEKVTVPYTKLDKAVAEISGNIDEYNHNMETGNKYNNKAIHAKAYNVFNSDMDLEDHYRMRFDRLYTNRIIPISKAFLDIEVDTKPIGYDFPEPGVCPINAVTYLNMSNFQCNTFLLRNPDNPLVQEFEDNLGKETFDELKELIKDTIGTHNYYGFCIDQLEFNIYFYDDEIQLIQDLFTIINKDEPDFLLEWNSGFDIPYILARVQNHFRIDPAIIINHPDYPVKICDYYIDERNLHMFNKRCDKARLGMKTTNLDQLAHFMSRRAGTVFERSKLDYIAQLLGVAKKYDYSNITNKVGELPYKNYKIFVIYNILDVIAQACIESKVNDMDYLFAKCNMNNTRYEKCHRQTIYLANRGTKEFYDQNFIIGNNVAKFRTKPEGKYPGAVVGNPKNVSDYSKLKINGIPVYLFNNLDDYDFKSLYPSTERENNMASNTMIGKIVIDSPTYKGDNKYNDPKYSRGGMFLEDLQSQVYTLFCNRWLHYGNFLDLIHDIQYYFKWIEQPMYSLYNHKQGENIQVASLTRFGNRDVVHVIKPGIIVPVSTVIPNRDYTSDLEIVSHNNIKLMSRKDDIVDDE